jgi:hypothetical protein
MSGLEKYHPVWRVGLNIVFLTVLLYAFASDFDETEIRTLLLFMMGHGAVEKFVK